MPEQAQPQQWETWWRPADAISQDNLPFAAKNVHCTEIKAHT